MNNRIIGISVKGEDFNSILDKTKLGTIQNGEMAHIVSINPEILIEARDSEIFKKIVETAQIQIIDGVGVVLAARILNIPIANRLTGVDLMSKLLEYASANSLSVGLIGGGEKIAERLVECQKQKYPELKVFGIQGIKDIKNPKKEEEAEIFRIVADRKPYLLFVAFGSPYQEMWIERHRNELGGMVCIGVGGAFDYLSGNVDRPNRIFRSIGLEWLLRLIMQPWRWKRQLRLIRFVWLVILQKINGDK